MRALAWCLLACGLGGTTLGGQPTPVAQNSERRGVARAVASFVADSIGASRARFALDLFADTMPDSVSAGEFARALGLARASRAAARSCAITGLPGGRRLECTLMNGETLVAFRIRSLTGDRAIAECAWEYQAAPGHVVLRSLVIEVVQRAPGLWQATRVLESFIS